MKKVISEILGDKYFSQDELTEIINTFYREDKTVFYKPSVYWEDIELDNPHYDLTEVVLTLPMAALLMGKEALLKNILRKYDLVFDSVVMSAKKISKDRNRKESNESSFTLMQIMNNLTHFKSFKKHEIKNAVTLINSNSDEILKDGFGSVFIVPENISVKTEVLKCILKYQAFNFLDTYTFSYIKNYKEMISHAFEFMPAFIIDILIAKMYSGAFLYPEKISEHVNEDMVKRVALYQRKNQIELNDESFILSIASNENFLAIAENKQENTTEKLEIIFNLEALVNFNLIQKLEKKADEIFFSEGKNDFEEYPFYHAVTMKNKDFVQSFIKKGYRPNIKEAEWLKQNEILNEEELSSIQLKILIKGINDPDILDIISELSSEDEMVVNERLQGKIESLTKDKMQTLLIILKNDSKESYRYLNNQARNMFTYTKVTDADKLFSKECNEKNQNTERLSVVDEIILNKKSLFLLELLKKGYVLNDKQFLLSSSVFLISDLSHKRLKYYECFAELAEIFSHYPTECKKAFLKSYIRHYDNKLIKQGDADLYNTTKSNVKAFKSRDFIGLSPFISTFLKGMSFSCFEILDLLNMESDYSCIPGLQKYFLENFNDEINIICNRNDIVRNAFFTEIMYYFDAKGIGKRRRIIYDKEILHFFAIEFFKINQDDYMNSIEEVGNLIINSPKFFIALEKEDRLMEYSTLMSELQGVALRNKISVSNKETEIQNNSHSIKQKQRL